MFVRHDWGRGGLKLTLAELAVHLPAQDVEHVGRLGQVRDLHVAVLMLALELVRRREDARVLVAELQVPFHPAGGVLGTLTIVAVRQAHHEPGALQPLDFAGRDELVDDDLRRVCEVAELRFPDDQRVGRGQGVAVLEAETMWLC